MLRLQAGVPEGRSVGAALSADEEQLRVHQEEDLPSHTPAGIDVLVLNENINREVTVKSFSLSQVLIMLVLLVCIGN